MSRSISGRPHVPWYREPWLWFLIALPGSVVIASFVTLYLAVTRADALVVDNYYTEGLAINRVLANDHLAFQRGYRADVMLNQDHTLVRIRLTGEPLPPGLRVRFVHPTKGGLDELMLAREILPGIYEGKVQLAAARRWDIDLEDSARTWRITGDWYPHDDHFVLEASAK